MPANAIQLSLLINLPDELQYNHTSSRDVEENATELTVQKRLCHLERSKSLLSRETGNIDSNWCWIWTPRPDSTRCLSTHLNQFLSTKPFTQNHKTAQVGRDIKRSWEPTSHGKGILDKIIQHPAQSGKSCKLPVMGTLSCPWGGSSSDWLFSLEKKNSSFIKIKLFPLQHPFAPCLPHEKYQLNNHLEGAQMQRGFQVLWGGGS